MGKKGSWFSMVRKALTPEPKEKKEKKPQKPKRRWFGKQKSVDEENLVAETAKASVADSTSSLPAPPPRLKVVKFTEPVEDEHTKLSNTVASATAMAAEAAVAAATEVFRFLHAARFPGKSTEEIAAIKIQAAVRGYLERRASRAWRGLVRLRLLIRGKSVQRQANTTLRCMQTLARVQYHIRARKIRLLEENQTLQRQLQQKRDKDIEIQQKRDKDIEKQLRVSMGDNWENSAQSKEKVEANLQYKQEAAMRRERALAYAYTQQQTWKNNPSKNTNQSLTDPAMPSWGWSWLERWMAARPWETKTGSEKDTNSEYCPSVMSTPSRDVSIGELSRTKSCQDLNLDIKASTTPPTTTMPSPSSSRSRAPTRQSLSFPRTKNAPVAPPPARERNRRSSSLGGDGDPRSPLSDKSERYRRHGYAHSLASDDESLSSLPASPSHKANAKHPKSRTSRMPSPLGRKTNGGGGGGGSGSTEKSPGFLKKRLSFSGSSSGRRRQSISGSPKNIRVDA